MAKDFFLSMNFYKLLKSISNFKYFKEHYGALSFMLYSHFFLI